jgi:cell division protein FtsX
VPPTSTPYSQDVARALLVSLALIVALVVSAPSTQASTPTARGCTVVIYLKVPVRASAIEAVKTRLRRDPQVVAYRFITRAEAFEQLRTRNPGIAANLTSNPLPARLHVQLQSRANSERFVTRYRALRLGAVDHVRTTEASRTSCVSA